MPAYQDPVPASDLLKPNTPQSCGLKLYGFFSEKHALAEGTSWWQLLTGAEVEVTDVATVSPTQYDDYRNVGQVTEYVRPGRPNPNAQYPTPSTQVPRI
jgi:hypothetical protein